MPTQVQFRRGTTAQNNNFVGAAGEISVDLDRMVLRVHDGQLAGGIAMVAENGTATYATNLVGGAVGSIPYQTAANATGYIGIGANGTILSSDGTTATWVNIGDLTAGNASSADTVLVGTQTAGDRYLVVTDQNGDYVSLEADNGSSAAVYNLGTGLAVNSTLTVSKHILPSTAGIDIGSLANPFRSLYVTSGTVYVGSVAIEDINGDLTINNQTIVTTATVGNLTANKAVNIVGGTAGQLPYQSAPGVTAFAGPGTAGQLLMSNGTSAPTYTSTASIYIENTVNAEKWKTPRTFTFSGDLSGSMVVDGSQDVTFTATVINNSVALGTDTTGDYVATGATSGYGISGSTSGETATFTVTSNATSTNATSTIVFRDSAGGFNVGNVSVKDTTAASSTSTGALKVEGGVGIGGNLYVGGEIVAQKLTIELTTVTTTLVTTDDIIQTSNYTQASSTTTGALVVAGGAGIGRDIRVGGNSYVGGNQTVTGTITHGGLVPTAGTGIDQVYTSTKLLTLGTTWQNTGISGTDLATGSYMVQVLASDSAVGGGEVNMYYTGVMSWYSGATADTGVNEIALSRAGASAGSGAVFLRTQASNGGTLALQVSGLTANNAASNYTFSFRRLI